MTVFLQKLYEITQRGWDGGTCSMHGEDEKNTYRLVRKPQEKRYWGRRKDNIKTDLKKYRV
jgi:hypothetical protein